MPLGIGAEDLLQHLGVAVGLAELHDSAVPVALQALRCLRDGIFRGRPGGSPCLLSWKDGKDLLAALRARIYPLNRTHPSPSG